MSGQSGGPGKPGTPPAAGGADPAMEDILASIRRILNEDDAPAAQPAEPEPEPDEPLNLTEDMLVKPDEPSPATPRPAPAPEPEAPSPPPQPSAAAEREAPVEAMPSSEQTSETAAASGLLAPAAAAAAMAAVGQLVRAVAQERGATVYRGGPTIEDVVREELRPMLKEWLDQHLPPLVERLVRAEIERVVGRAIG
jgi:cell pole-organizing protein PopZ